TTARKGRRPRKKSRMASGSPQAKERRAAMRRALLGEERGGGFFLGGVAAGVHGPPPVLWGRGKGETPKVGPQPRGLPPRRLATPTLIARGPARPHKSPAMPSPPTTAHGARQGPGCVAGPTPAGAGWTRPLAITTAVAGPPAAPGCGPARRSSARPGPRDN